jgi:hypothetical protein
MNLFPVVELDTSLYEYVMTVPLSTHVLFGSWL